MVVIDDLRPILLDVSVVYAIVCDLKNLLSEMVSLRHSRARVLGHKLRPFWIIQPVEHRLLDGHCIIATDGSEAFAFSNALADSLNQCLGVATRPAHLSLSVET